jgi:hypothetical protein
LRIAEMNRAGKRQRYAAPAGEIGAISRRRGSRLDRTRRRTGRDAPGKTGG